MGKQSDEVQQMLMRPITFFRNSKNWNRGPEAVW
jgi:hypothetical protein